MDSKIWRGDRVIVELQNELFTGTVEYASSECIELYDIFCHKLNSTHEANMVFYRPEVLSVRVISQQDISKPAAKVLKMNKEEYNRINEMTYNFEFIDIFNTSFTNAVSTLMNRESVAVVGLGNSFQRGKPLCLLAISDFAQIYIFDLLCLVQLKGLQRILEADFIQKVVHDGVALFDCLYHKYGVEMQNVFDTQIVDSELSRKDNNVEIKRNISEALEYHFNFPHFLLSAAIEDVSDATWRLRPLTKGDKIKVGQLVAFLLPLRDCLSKIIFKSFTELTWKTYNKCKTISDTELLKVNIKNN